MSFDYFQCMFLGITFNSMLFLFLSIAIKKLRALGVVKSIFKILLVDTRSDKY